MKKKLIVSVASLLCLTVTGQNVNELNRQANIDWKEDSTEIVTIEDIVKTQQGLTTNRFIEDHFQDVWARKSYLNLSYNSTSLNPDGQIATGVGSGIVPDFKTNWGFSLQLGRSYKLHKKPISNLLQFYIDFTYIDLNVNHYDHEGDGKNLYDSSVKLPGTDCYYTPWNLEKYEFNYGMALGPSVTFAPFTSMDSRGLHFLKLNLWYHIGYHVSLLNMKSDVNADANKDAISGSSQKEMKENVKLDLGHGLISSFGVSLTWKFIGVGYEYRSAALKYKSLDKDTFGSDEYKFKSSTNRMFLQLRF